MTAGNDFGAMYDELKASMCRTPRGWLTWHWIHFREYTLTMLWTRIKQAGDDLVFGKDDEDDEAG